MKQSTSPDNITASGTSSTRCEGVYLAALRLDTDGNPLPQIQVLPSGAFRARDGRPATEYPHLTDWVFDDAAAKAVLAALATRQTPLVIDYEHQTINTEINGQPAPAAGWVETLPQWQPETGLVMEVKWTARAKAMIKADEYRYLSPVFSFDPATGRVLSLHHVALTNYPALDGLKPVTARHTTQALQETPDMLLKPETLTLLGVDASASAETIHAAIAALKSAPNPSVVDPAQYVPVAQFETLKIEMAALTARQQQAEVDDLIETGRSSGKLLAAQETWARELGNKDVAALRSYLDTTPAIAALKGSQTHGKPPTNDAAALTAAHHEAARIGGWDLNTFKELN